MKPKIVGVSPPANANDPKSNGRKQAGVDEVFMPRVSPEVLVKMDHADWLQSFAKVMQMQTGVEMTPMRAGVISRCNLAAEFIRYLQADNRKVVLRLAELTSELAQTRKKKKASDGESDG